MRYENVLNSKKISQVTKSIWKNIRNSIDKITDDRPMENDINTSSLILEEFVKGSKTKNDLLF
jgi:histidine ammonia-lyase